MRPPLIILVEPCMLHTFVYVFVCYNIYNIYDTKKTSKLPLEMDDPSQEFKPTIWCIHNFTNWNPSMLDFHTWDLPFLTNRDPPMLGFLPYDVTLLCQSESPYSLHLHLAATHNCDDCFDVHNCFKILWLIVTIFGLLFLWL